jgi:phosphoenolpyruvate-protein kinase (PTS system EI component)
MSPSFIPTIKALTSHLTVPMAQQVLRRALRLSTTRQVQRFMEARMKEISPDLTILDTA